MVSGIFLLLGISYLYLAVKEKSSEDWLIKKGEALSSAVVIKGLNYTLNYKQHNGVLQEFNHSTPIENPQLPPLRTHPVKILIYKQAPHPLELIPLSSDFAFFKVLNKNAPPFFIKLKQAENLKNIVELTHDR